MRVTTKTSRRDDEKLKLDSDVVKATRALDMGGALSAEYFHFGKKKLAITLHLLISDDQFLRYGTFALLSTM
jgi:hypothetical protein